MACAKAVRHVAVIQRGVQVVKREFDAERSARIPVEQAGDMKADWLDALLMHVNLKITVERIGELGIEPGNRRAGICGQTRTQGGIALDHQTLEVSRWFAPRYRPSE